MGEKDMTLFRIFLLSLLIFNKYLSSTAMKPACPPFECLQPNYSICENFSIETNESMKICGLEDCWRNRTIKYQFHIRSQTLQNLSIYFHPEFFKCLHNSSVKIQSREDIDETRYPITTLSKTYCSSISSRNFVMEVYLNISCLTTNSYSLQILYGGDFMQVSSSVTLIKYDDLPDKITLPQTKELWDIPNIALLCIGIFLPTITILLFILYYCSMRRKIRKMKNDQTPKSPLTNYYDAVGKHDYISTIDVEKKVNDSKVTSNRQSYISISDVEEGNKNAKLEETNTDKGEMENYENDQSSTASSYYDNAPQMRSKTVQVDGLSIGGYSLLNLSSANGRL
ncbi:DgyrCDS9180 [Dimorphilus gyrociliatus]|uniref:DgyrCDS9180 n=1 Tax=Dimorphilus gyrociliatus TaxID=2664684 RepID=A0A7I8VWB6_9ANNE|nr:DgyrCDS9180 [Dimorphilus gyrociliatus]